MRYRFNSPSRRLLLTAAACASLALTAASPIIASREGVREKRIARVNGNSATSSAKEKTAEPRDFISDIALTNNDFQSTSLCREAGFAATYAFSTVPYFTLDEPRSVTLSYNGDRAFPRPFVFVTVAPDYGSATVAEYWLEVSVNGSPRTFVNGDTKLVFTGTTNEQHLETTAR